MGFKEDTIRMQDRANNRVRCKCSHTITIVNKDRVICNYCGSWVYRTKEIEFQYKLKESRIKC